MFRITQGHPRLHPVFAYRPFTFYGVAFQPLRLTFRIPHRSPTTPGAKPLVWADPLSLATTYGVSVDVLSSGYLDISVRRVCFLSDDLTVGFPHSEIHGSKLIRSSPWLIAAYYVLHRLSTPRHSPNAL